MRTKKRYILVAWFGVALGLVTFSFLFLSPWAKTSPDNQKTLTPSSCVSVTVVVVSGEPKELLLPKAFSLSQNYPNPFNPQTIIEYTLPKSCHVQLTIYNIMGQSVKVLVNQYQAPGYKRVEWDGKNDQGEEVASGVYFYKFEARDFTHTKKMVILR